LGMIPDEDARGVLADRFKARALGPAAVHRHVSPLLTRACCSPGSALRRPVLMRQRFVGRLSSARWRKPPSRARTRWTRPPYGNAWCVVMCAERVRNMRLTCAWMPHAVRDCVCPHVSAPGHRGIQAHEPPAQGAVLCPPQDGSRVRSD
jgi:hypothetical protein